jgi:excinuclease UvrABC nuclease subunit
MIKTRLYSPYDAKGKTTFPSRAKSGVYLIYKEDVLRYVGYSASDIYKTMYRHFQSWPDPKQVRVVYKNLKGVKVRVIYCTPSQAAKLERAIIIRHEPKDNPQKLLNFKMDAGETAVLKSYYTADATPVDDVPF